MKESGRPRRDLVACLWRAFVVEGLMILKLRSVDTFRDLLVEFCPLIAVCTFVTTGSFTQCIVVCVERMHEFQQREYFISLKCTWFVSVNTSNNFPAKSRAASLRRSHSHQN